MAGRGRGDPAQSPYVWESGDYQGRVIRITIVFNNATRAITSASVFRDADCVFTRLYLGRGTDGSPNSSTRSITVPDGTTNVPVQQMANRGFSTIEDFLGLQITAGP